MKLKRNQWGVIFLLVIVIAFVWAFGGFKEMFTAINPALSKDDANSIDMSPQNTTGNAASFQQWVWKTYPNIAKYDMMIPALASNVAAYGNVVMTSVVSGTPSLNDFYTQLATALQNPPFQTFTPQDVATSYAITDPSKDTNRIYANAIYNYYFGNPPAPVPYVPPTPPSSPPTTQPSKPTPAPASSSSTQPMTVPIPSPCHPSYKNIPGGSMEFKCFN